ncbi:MAG: MoxR family ATPase [Lentisphaeria bacterium]|nr:MoxR family ATPase [Lentisphaeria bacterium]
MNIPEKLSLLRQNLNKVICGKTEPIEYLLMTMVAGGHLLLDDVPGVGKTTLAKALAKSLALDFHRVQFTPDLLPSDILGTNVYDQRTAAFTFRPGPVFSNILLADEINRASPRTQSALLESMSEHQVTTDGVSRSLPPVFMVIATENPIEFQGTYPLPEAQLDRFMMRISLGYPDEASELRLLMDREKADPLESLQPVLTGEDLLQIRQTMRKIDMEQSVMGYLVRLLRATREDSRIALGCSPRAVLMLADCARAAALLDNRDYVLPDDIRDLAPVVLSHRIVLSGESRYAGLKASEVLADIIRKVSIPL